MLAVSHPQLQQLSQSGGNSCIENVDEFDVSRFLAQSGNICYGRKPQVYFTQFEAKNQMHFFFKETFCFRGKTCCVCAQTGNLKQLFHWPLPEISILSSLFHVSRRNTSAPRKQQQFHNYINPSPLQRKKCVDIPTEVTKTLF